MDAPPQNGRTIAVIGAVLYSKEAGGCGILHEALDVAQERPAERLIEKAAVVEAPVRVRIGAPYGRTRS